MTTIDVTEILKASTNSEPRAKKLKVDSFDKPYASENSAADILVALQDDNSQGITFDEQHVKKLVLQLEKKALKNREMRIKYSDDPKKFMESEIELDTATQELHALATQPDLYTVFVDSGGPSLLLSLLSHENTDILAATINLLQELTDVDVLNEGAEGAVDLISSLAQGKVIETFVSCFDRLDNDKSDEADAIHNALSVVENMIDFRPETSDDCVREGLFLWLLRRACQKGEFDANKMYSSELVALLLQASQSARAKLTEKIDGMDILLRALASYKRHDPSTLDEREHMENLFGALCASLLHIPNRHKFLEGEGLQLMNLMLREKKMSRASALKVLDHALSGQEGKENCNKFVEILGLRTLFPLFLRTPSKVKRKDTSPDEHEEHVTAVLASLFRCCTEDARQRMMLKFVENGHEKIDRAVELLIKYREKVEHFERKRVKAMSDSLDEDEDRDYLNRLDAGLYTLQNLCLILSDVCVSTPSCKERAAKLLSMKLRHDKIATALIPILEEYAINLGEDAKEERDRLKKLIENIIHLDN